MGLWETFKIQIGYGVALAWQEQGSEFKLPRPAKKDPNLPGHMSLPKQKQVRKFTARKA
jgi:hypothetical protein